MAKKKAPPTTIHIHDAGFIKNGPDDWEENRKHLLKLLDEEKDPKKRELIVASGAHGHWTTKELTKDLKNYSLFR